MESTTDQPDSDCGKEFEKYMFICHLYAVRCAFGDISSLGTLVVKVLVALLRYTDIIPADKAYYEAGIATRVRTNYTRNRKFKFFRLYQCIMSVTHIIVIVPKDIYEIDWIWCLSPSLIYILWISSARLDKIKIGGNF